MKQYVSRAKYHLDNSNLFGEERAVPLRPSPYKDYSTSIAYVPSTPVLRDAVCRYFESTDTFEGKVMQGIDGGFFKGDASHKVTKLIYVNVDDKVFHFYIP
jgi:hypothetical protein